MEEIKITVIKKHHPEDNSVGYIYYGDYELPLNNNFVTLKIKVVENPTPGKSNAYIENFNCLKWKNEKNKLTAEEREAVSRIMNKYLFFLSDEIEKQKKISMRKNNKCKRNKDKSFNCWELPDKIVVDDDYSVIPKKLSIEDIEHISKTKEINKKLFSSSTIDLLKNFRNEWDKFLKTDSTKEHDYQNILYENPEVIWMIFGYNPAGLKKEAPLDEERKNKIDIGGDDWIIELKTPRTNIVTNKNKRNLISGINTDLISAIIQLSLYVKKKNRNKKLINSFTKGTLIIGEKDLLKKKEDEMSFKLLKEMANVNVVLYSEITEKVNDFIKFFEHNDKEGMIYQASKDKFREKYDRDLK